MSGWKCFGNGKGYEISASFSPGITITDEQLSAFDGKDEDFSNVEALQQKNITTCIIYFINFILCLQLGSMMMIF